MSRLAVCLFALVLFPGCSTTARVAEPVARPEARPGPPAWIEPTTVTALTSSKVFDVDIAPTPTGWVSAVTFEHRAAVDGREVSVDSAVEENELARGVAFTLLNRAGEVERQWEATVDTDLIPTTGRFKDLRVSSLSGAPDGSFAVGLRMKWYVPETKSRAGVAVLRRYGADGALRDELVLGGSGVEITDIEWSGRHGWVFVAQFYEELRRDGERVADARWAGAAVYRWGDSGPTMVKLLDGAEELTQLALVGDDVVASGFFSPYLEIDDEVVMHREDRLALAFAIRFGLDDGETRWTQVYEDAGDTRVTNIGEVVDGELLVGNVSRLDGTVHHPQLLIASIADGHVTRRVDKAEAAPILHRPAAPRRGSLAPGTRGATDILEYDGLGRALRSWRVSSRPQEHGHLSRAARSGGQIAAILVGHRSARTVLFPAALP